VGECGVETVSYISKVHSKLHMIVAAEHTANPPVILLFQRGGIFSQESNPSLRLTQGKLLEKRERQIFQRNRAEIMQTSGTGHYMRALGLFLFLLVSACAAIEPAYRDERFLIFNHGDFSSAEIHRVKAQLEVGTNALEKYIGSIPADKFPVVVNLRPGRGVSHSGHGRGAIELYWVREAQAPIIHELTHVLAGYTASNGHWTQEGFASYMQDQYGEDSAFPTRKMAHALVKVLGEERSLLPMLEVMKDRNRAKYFGLDTPWERWLAYTQSTSFCRYLIERHGHEKFLKIYDLPFGGIDFDRLYGKKPEVLLNEWSSYVAGLSADTAKARAVFHNMKTLLVRE
jgi:hypothetical protein